jgi:hypothetical protein
MSEMKSPLTWWREKVMPKVTTVPTALLRQDNGLVQEGDMLTNGTTRRVRLCSVIPDTNGMVTVQETYQVTPEQIGLHLRPETVILELTREEATAVLEFYKSTKGVVTPQAGEVLEALKSNDTRADIGGGRG